MGTVAMAWSVETLPSKLAARFRFPTGLEILISILELGVYRLCYVLCYLWLWPWHSAGHRFREVPLVYLYIVMVHNLCSPYRNLTHGRLDCMSLWCNSYRVNHPGLDPFRTQGDWFIRNDPPTRGGFVPRFCWSRCSPDSLIRYIRDHEHSKKKEKEIIIVSFFTLDCRECTNYFLKIYLSFLLTCITDTVS